MNFMIFVILCSAFAAAKAGLFGGALVGPGEPGAVLQGPGATAALHGPDGSVIAANQPGGAVIAAPKAGGVISAGVAPGYIAHHGAVVGAPIVARAGLLAAYNGYPAFAAGSGLEGQYVPEYTENLYDNGQYHGELYA